MKHIRKRFSILSLVALSAVIIMSIAYASDKGLGFIAPWVNQTSDVPNPVKGEIVYDYPNNVLKSYDGTSWYELGAISTDEMVKTPGTLSPRVAVVASANIDSGAGISNQHGSFLSSCTATAPGDVTCDFNTGYWNSFPNCNVTSIWNGSTDTYISVIRTVSTTSIRVTTTRLATGAFTHSTFSLICHGLR